MRTLRGTGHRAERGRDLRQEGPLRALGARLTA